MNKRNGISTHRLQVSVDSTTDKILSGMIPIGLHGRNKSEVASWILREWIWHNQDKLEHVGVSLRPKRVGPKSTKR